MVSTALSTMDGMHLIDTVDNKNADNVFYILPSTLRNWPYERSINRYYRTGQAESVKWLESFKTFSPAAQSYLNKCDLGLLSALTYPKASHGVFRSCCDLMHTFFTLDDHTDSMNTEATKMHCEATMDAILHPDKPRPKGEPIIGEITRQFWKRASSYAPQAVQGRFIKSWRAYLDSVITQAARRDLSHYVCTIEEYLDSRCDNIGAYPSFIFLELSLNIDIPHYVMENSTIVTLNRVAADMIALGNDICSYKKEILTNDADYNAITVVMHNNNVGVDGAIQWISDFHDELVAHFLSLGDEVRNKIHFPSYGEDVDRQIEAYVEGLGQWVRGHDEWSFASCRYFGDEGLNVQRTRRVVMA